DRGTIICWLLGITQRQAALMCRKRKRVPIATGDSRLDLQLATDDGAEQRLATQESAEAIRLTLAGLPEEAAVLLIRRYLDSLTTAELALEYGISEQAIRSRLVRARDRFREFYDARFREP
ncbi:MAG: sigma-70 family RNA polymerase sigma factor, partial [Planctomycetaceae bacterium]|nr:sigma-70 family RNA polymerase sigma factor [Planctomycetaceae bacterium]